MLFSKLFKNSLVLCLLSVAIPLHLVHGIFTAKQKAFCILTNILLVKWLKFVTPLHNDLHCLPNVVLTFRLLHRVNIAAQLL